MKSAPYGTWSSPITTGLIVAESVRLGGVAIDGEDVYWLEGRPGEGGRNVLVRKRADGTPSDATPAPLNVRTRVHEYGGGAFLVSRRRLWFVNFEDQRIYGSEAGSPPEPITAPSACRYADFVLDEARERLVCVREDHGDGGREPVNELVGVAYSDGAVEVLASGHDFYSSPCLSPDGAHLAWLTWDHPDMPWDATELWVGELDADGRVRATRKVAGGPGVSVFQPCWSPGGELHLVSDASGWWNLYRWDGEDVRCLLPMEAEFGRPQWQFGTATFGFAGDGRPICSYARDGRWHLARLDAAGRRLEPLAEEYTDVQGLCVAGDRALFIGGNPRCADAVISLDLASGEARVLRESAPRRFDEAYVSVPEPVEFPTGERQHAHAYYYAPCNPGYRAPEGELPPLVVIGHGGPTGATSPTLSLKVQYWTSRGFAVLDVDYRGSTGYGRAYRELLNGQWGVADVEDCVNGARHLADRGRADPARLVIRGGSAGGYTTLAALAYHDVFRAGASYYGVSDLEALAEDTHKFESRYLDRLVGPYPERRDVYRERSPKYAADRLSCPVIFFQGLEDKVVPPAQAELMVEVLREKGLPVAYLAFEGEQHGFRQAETIERTLQAELYFYGRVFGFEPADDIAPVPIENL